MNSALRANCRLAFLIAFALSVQATTSSAEPISLSVTGGRSAPVGDLADDVADGHYIGLSASKPVVQDELIVFLDLNYHALGGRMNPFVFNDWTIRQSLRITETAFGIRVPFVPPRARVSPYFELAAAIEFVEPKAVIDMPSQSIIIVDPKFRGGGIGAIGVSLRLGRATGLRVEAAYHAIESDTKTLTVRTLGLTLWSGVGHR